jgi:hypothetical protein
LYFSSVISIPFTPIWKTKCIFKTGFHADSLVL